MTDQSLLIVHRLAIYNSRVEAADGSVGKSNEWLRIAGEIKAEIDELNKSIGLG